MSLGVLLLNQLMRLQEAGYDVVAMSNPGPYFGQLRQAGIRAVPATMVRAITPWSDVGALARLTRILRRERPDIVHTHTPKAALLGQYAALLARVPIRVHTIHGLYFPGHMSPRTRPIYVGLERLTMRYADLALSQNPEDIPVAIQERICRPEQIQYLGNGIDLSRFDPARVDPAAVERLRTELGIAPGERVVGIVGRVNREKGYPEFFEAAAQVARRFPETRFLVVGPVEREKTNALDPLVLAEQAGVTRQTIYAGLRDDMPELYSLMDVLVLPSHREGFPRSPMEASAMAGPVVATDIRGCRQVVDHGVTGYLVPLRAPVPLAEAVGALLADPDGARRMGRAARERALSHFDERRVIERTMAAYDALLARKGSRGRR